MFMLDRSMQNKQEEPVSPKWQCNASPWLSVVPVKYPLSDTFFLSWETHKLCSAKKCFLQKGSASVQGTTQLFQQRSKIIFEQSLYSNALPAIYRNGLHPLTGMDQSIDIYGVYSTW